MEIHEFQNLIRKIYYEKDSKRGVEGTFMWFTEEVGELAQQIRKRDRSELADEFGDVLAWLVSLASLLEIDVEEAIRKYESGCPKCGEMECQCRPVNPKSPSILRSSGPKGK